ncbi:MAG: hypothetical protein J1E62_02855 [Lachnospiraceae bacterium]|nr:hypothetical protein [Lachnospiraceae bacterium]
MSLVEQFGLQQKQYWGNNWQKKNSKTNEKSNNNQKVNSDRANAVNNGRVGKSQNMFNVELSDKAKNLLEELQQKYTNMDFIIANYDSDEEAQRLLSRGTKEYSVLIDPETLEAMAADEATKEKYLGIIDDATSQLRQMVDELGEDGKEVTRLGIVVHNDGSVSYFAELEQLSARQKERIEATREEKKAEDKENEKRAEKRRKDEALQERIANHAKRTTVEADSIEALMEAIRNVNWEQVKSAPFRQSGARFDFSF